MDWLQTLLNGTATPVLTAFLLGLPDHTITLSAGSQHGGHRIYRKDIRKQKHIFGTVLLYTLGRVLSYTPARSGTDYDSERRFQHVRHSEDYRDMGVNSFLVRFC